MTVAAGGQQIFPVRGDNKVTRMNPRQLIAYLCQHTGFQIYFEDGKTVTFQAIAGIQVFPVGTEMYIGTATRTKCVGCNGLYLFQFAIQVAESGDITG